MVLAATTEARRVFKFQRRFNRFGCRMKNPLYRSVLFLPKRVIEAGKCCG
jgi:hypothetical protein